MKRAIWQTPEVLVDVLDEQTKLRIRKEILEPAERHIKENMIREGVMKFCNLKIQTPPTFRDMGGRPLRFRKKTFKRVLPFRIRTTKKVVSSSINDEYETGDLIQISQRLVRGKKWPAFEVNESAVQGKHKDGIRIVLEIIMIGFVESDYEYEVVRVSDIK